MNEQNKYLARLLRALADCVESSSPAEIEELLAGKMSLGKWSRGLHDRQPRSRPPGQNPDRKGRSWEQHELVALSEQLRNLASRDEGLDLLCEAKLSKKDLERLARAMDLPVVREDNSDKLRNKIVEAYIGSRLNSRAIRGV
jgi:hypothetical protein